MALHPQCKAFLDQIAAGGGRPLHEMTPVEARARARPPDLAGPEQPVHEVANRPIEESLRKSRRDFSCSA